MPARQAFTVEMTSREDLMNAISLNSSIFNGARVIGPSVAGFLVSDAMRGRVMGIWALVFGGTIPLWGTRIRLAVAGRGCALDSRGRGAGLRRCRSGDVEGRAPQSSGPSQAGVQESSSFASYYGQPSRAG